MAAAPAPDPVALEVGSGRVVQLPGPAANLFVADPKIAEARPASPTSLFIFGQAVGRTTVAVTDVGGHPVVTLQVTVAPPAGTASLAAAAIGAALPGSGVQVTAAGDGLTLSGHVATAAQAEQAASIARGFLADKQVLTDRLEVGGGQQVLLRVRIAEMSRTLTRDLGLNWQNLGGNLGDFARIGLSTLFPLADVTGGTAPVTAAASLNKTGVEAILDALAQDQLVHVLAEPNLTAMSGESASFLVGGEFPVPVSQGQGAVSVSFKQYGISVAFVPTVLDGDRISMRVRPEVSQLTNQGAVQLSTTSGNLVIPALQVRRADTTVELGSGQSFAIAGLLSDTVTHSGNGVPGLGDTPVLGGLFRSDSFQQQQTELVILVTPFLVRPVSRSADLRLPTDGWQPPNDLERILLLRQSAAGSANGAAAPPHITGDVGFIVQ
jgi:pilus assembly protein CpaC